MIIKGNAAEEEEDKKDDTENGNTGTDNTGTDNTGKDDTGKDDTGKDNTGKDNAVTGDTGTDNTVKNPIIVKLENVALSGTNFTFNGMAQQPYVVAKDAQGRQISSADYTVTYHNNRDVGQATVTIAFKNNYAGTLVKTFTILPKGTSITKVTSKKKGIALRWKKQASQTTGYEIQYSTNSRFKGMDVRTVKIKKNKTVSKTISKLKAKKKYFISIRTYKTVNVNGKKTNFYSGWSGVKKATTRK